MAMETWKLLDGETEVRDEGAAVRFRVRCRPPCEPTRLLRCYGEAEPADLLIGVLEPQNGRLTLERRISRESLRQAGVQELPTRFYLSDGGAREKSASPPPDDAPPESAPKAAQPETPPETGNAGKAPKEAASKPLETASASKAPAKTAPKSPKTGSAGASPAKSTSGPPKAAAADMAAPESPPAERRESGSLEDLLCAEPSAAPPIKKAPPATANPAAKAAPREKRGKTADAPPRTGDALLDAVLARGEARCETLPDGLRITCPFSSKQPFALAFIAPLCRVEHRHAVLDWKNR